MVIAQGQIYQYQRLYWVGNCFTYVTNSWMVYNYLWIRKSWDDLSVMELQTWLNYVVVAVKILMNKSEIKIVYSSQ